MTAGTPGQAPAPVVGAPVGPTAADPASVGRAPVVGVTAYREDAAWTVWRQPAALIPQSYLDCVVRAGGTAVLLPPQPAAGAERVVALLDALVLAGGPDIDPARYGAAPGPHTGAPHAERDAWELALARAALDRDLPVLGVCRGLQLLNVALGGTLAQHLPEEAHRQVPARFVRRGVRTAAGSRLAAVLGPAADANCYHHQAVARLASGLNATAWAGDGTVEGAESPAHRFVLGVQWHPETDQDDLRLFAALVAAAAGAATGNELTGPAARKETAV